MKAISRNTLFPAVLASCAALSEPVLHAQIVTKAPATNTVRITENWGKVGYYRSSFIPTERLITPHKSRPSITLARVNGKGIRCSVDIQLWQGVRAGRALPFSGSYSEVAQDGSMARVWNFEGGKVVIDSVQGSLCRFRIINAQLSNGRAGITKPKNLLLLNYAGSSMIGPKAKPFPKILDTPKPQFKLL